MTNDIWAASARERLQAARRITPEKLSRIHESLARDCPIEPWPYGNATVVNPMLVTLGVSPGNRPAPGDTDSPPGGGHQFPTAGSPHPGTRYCDPVGYWDKLRTLARTTLAEPRGAEDEAFLCDALSLFGNLNLHTGRSAEAKDVVVRPDFAAWLLRTIRDGLRPRVVVMLGLRGYLRRTNRKTAEAFEECFPRFSIKKPHREVRFAAYREKRYVFREWDIACANGNEMKLIMWPQTPSRPPFSQKPELWQASCDEFADRYRDIFSE